MLVEKEELEPRDKEEGGEDSKEEVMGHTEESGEKLIKKMIKRGKHDPPQTG